MWVIELGCFWVYGRRESGKGELKFMEEVVVFMLS